MHETGKIAQNKVATKSMNSHVYKVFLHKNGALMVVALSFAIYYACKCKYCADIIKVGRRVYMT